MCTDMHEQRRIFRLYRVHHQLLSVITVEGSKGFLNIPSGTVVVVTQLPPEDSQLVEVLWDRNRSMVFMQDLLDRADLIGEEKDLQGQRQASTTAAPLFVEVPPR